MKKTQKDRVLEYMQFFGSITWLDAYKDLGVARLSAVIWTLRHEDEIEIESVSETMKNRYGEKCSYFRYYLKGSEFENQLKKEGIISGE